LPKSGSAFDLPIALAILAASEQIPVEFLSEFLIIGELALNGEIKNVRGTLPMLLTAKNFAIDKAIVPIGNLAEAALVKDMKISGFATLSELLEFIRTGREIIRESLDIPIERSSDKDFSEVAGLAESRSAIEVAAAGGHHFLMVGPPGAGKTMLAERLPTILPPLSESEALEVAGIHSIAGHWSGITSISSSAPFVAPHHATTIPALIGGGVPIKPGAASLAHRGVLFIDEAPECATGLLDSLRQPLEAGEVAITRSNGTAIFPARFILALAANPCPCGKFAGRGRGCVCTSPQVRRYLGRLSGPLLDRVDIRIRVEQPTRVEITNLEPSESSAVIRERVIHARLRSQLRFSSYGFKLNSEIPSRLLREDFRAERHAMSLLHDLLDREEISARGFHRILRTAWSVADLAERDIPGRTEVERAINLRMGYSVDE
jgi:magnesium chelatase family protein